MGVAQVVRWDGFADGVRAKIWIYDDRAQFQAAGELWIEPSMVESFLTEIEHEQEDAKQYQFDFDQ